MVGTGAIVSMALGGIICTALPVAAIIFLKKKYPAASLVSMAVGAGTFVVFALILEQIIHLIMLPVVSGSTAAYVAYGALAAGVFEETGRFLACRFLMKKRSDTANAVMMGLGHGGIEAILLTGASMLSGIITAFMVNSMGIDGLAKLSGITDAETLSLLQTQVDALASVSIGSALLAVAERVFAITLHVCMTVIVMKAAAEKRKLWLYPAAILVHALFDVPAALYQRGVITSVWVVELILLVECAVIAAVVIKSNTTKETKTEV